MHKNVLGHDQWWVVNHFGRLKPPVSIPILKLESIQGVQT